VGNPTDRGSFDRARIRCDVEDQGSWFAPEIEDANREFEATDGDQERSDRECEGRPRRAEPAR
jgi:hypothetical protein